MNAVEWLDKAKEKLKLDSDYKLAKIIGITASSISNIRKRNSGIDTYIASRIEDILELRQMTVIIDLEIQKAKTKERKEYWEKKERIYLNN
jgi:hypothetical protein